MMQKVEPGDLFFDTMYRLLVVTRQDGGQVACRFYWRARMSQLSGAARVAELPFRWDDPGLEALEPSTTQLRCQMCGLIFDLDSQRPV